MPGACALPARRGAAGRRRIVWEARSGRHGLVGGSPACQSVLPEKRRQGACVRSEGSRCEKTEAAIKKPIAAPALTLSGTRPPLRNLCVLPAVRAAVGGFLRRRGALCAGRCTLGRLFGLTDAARPRTWRHVITHCMRDKVHVTNSWQSSVDPAAHAPYASLWPCAWDGILML